jgi:hypothetical protein
LYDPDCPAGISFRAPGSVHFHNKLIEEISLPELSSRKRWDK